MGFSRQEYWSGLPFPSPGDLPDPGIEPRASTLQADALPSKPPGKLQNDWARKPLLNSLVKIYLNSKTRSYFRILNKWNFISHLIVMQVPTDVNLHRQIWQEVLPNFCDDIHWRLTLSKSQRRGFEHILIYLILDEFPSVLYILECSFTERRSNVTVSIYLCQIL